MSHSCEPPEGTSSFLSQSLGFVGFTCFLSLYVASSFPLKTLILYLLAPESSYSNQFVSEKIRTWSQVSSTL